MVADSITRFSPPHSIVGRTTKHPIKSSWRHSNGSQTRDFVPYDAVSTSPNGLVPSYEDLPASDDDSSVDISMGIPVHRVKKRNFQSSLIMQVCDNDHPLANVGTSPHNPNKMTKEPVVARSPLGENTILRIDNTKKAHPNSHSKTTLSNTSCVGQPLIKEEESALFSFKESPLIRNGPRHFCQENSSFLRMYAAEKEMLIHGKITRFTCSPWKNSSSTRKMDQPEEIFGIVAKLPKIRRQRTWCSEKL